MNFIQKWTAKEKSLGYPDDFTKFVEYSDHHLPDAAAPCLSFSDAKTPRKIWEVFSPHSVWPESAKERLNGVLMIGSDGAGNPICVEEETGKVVLLDHEDFFVTSQFMNTSVKQLAEALLVYMGEKNQTKLKEYLREIDPDCLSQGSFWWHESELIEDSEALTPEEFWKRETEGRKQD